ncbi:putative protein IDA [Arabidopsis thaliana]
MYFHGSSSPNHIVTKKVKKQKQTRTMARIGALILVLFISISQLASFSTARKFPVGIPSVIDGVIFSGEISAVSKKVTVVGCEGEDDHLTAGYSSYITGKFGSLVLNALPKGSVPASGPSKRINDVKT